MTCIVGLVNKKDKSVIIGADSAGVQGWEISIRKDPKIFFVGEFLIGCTTSFRMIQLLQHSLVIPEIKGKDLFKFMCTDFVNAVRTCFTEGGYLQKSEDGDDKGGTFLIGYQNRLFRMDNDFQVAEHVNGMHSIGVGKDYSLGSLYSTKFTNLTPEQRVKQALEAACEFSMGVTKPLLIMQTNKKLKLKPVKKLIKLDERKPLKARITVESRPDLMDIFNDTKNKRTVFPEGVFAKSLEELPVGKIVVIQISPALYNQNGKDILKKLGYPTDSMLCIWGKIDRQFEDQSVTVVDQFGGLRQRNPTEISIVRGVHEGKLFPKEEPSSEFFDLPFKEKYPNV